MNRTGANGPGRERLRSWLASQEEDRTRFVLPVMPQISEAYLDRRGVVFLKVGDDLCRQYEGPIDVGMVFAWEPDIPTARQLIVVCEIIEVENDERRVWTLDLDSPMRGQPLRQQAAMRHVASYLFEGAPVWNDESRFREAVVPTVFKSQTP